MASTQDQYGATELWSQNLLQKVSSFSTFSQPILPHTTKRCLPTSLETSGLPEQHWKQPVGALCCLPFDEVSHKLALTEGSAALTEPGGIGACETSSRPRHIRCVLLVKDQVQEAAKHFSPGA